MLKTTYNDFGAEMIENRATMNHLDLDEMTKDERKSYLSICDQVATTAFAYIANGNPDNFPAFRSALHALFTFVGTETRILALDAYSTRFIPAVVPYKVMKSKNYKTAEKHVRACKRAIEWACAVSGIDAEDSTAVVFPKATDATTMEKEYFNSETQDSYNLCVTVCMNAWKNEVKPILGDLKAMLTVAEEGRDKLAQEPWQYYKDFKDPMLSSTGKKLKHAPESIRKNIEDTMADLLNQRELMTTAQLVKEEAQVKGGKKA